MLHLFGSSHELLPRCKGSVDDSNNFDISEINTVKKNISLLRVNIMHQE